MISRKSIVPSALVAICVLIFIALFHWRPTPITVRMEIRTEQAARLLFVFSSGVTAREDGYVVRMVDSRNDFETVRFPIDQKQLASFRLLQVDGAGPLTLRNLVIERFGGDSIPIAAEQLTPTAGIAALNVVGQTIEIRSAPNASGTDLMVRLPRRVRQTALAPTIEWLLVTLLGSACLGFLWATRVRASPGANPPKQEPMLPGGNRLRTWVVALLTLLYFGSSLGGLNGSSSAAWRFYADREKPDDRLILGSAKHIRSDEWQVQTPWILSQAAQKPDLPLLNRGVGDGPATLITSLPVRHWSIVFRPQYWGFFFLNLEQAFAFYWNFKWYALLLGAFLFFDLATRRQSLLALAAAAFIYFSGFTQWWFSSPTSMPEMIGTFFLALWAMALLVRTPSRLGRVGASLVLLVALIHFVLCCYPRFQIPLIYLGFFILLGGLLQLARGRAHRDPAIIYRLSLLVGTLLAAGLILWCWHADVGELLREIRRLIYPGQLFSTGGWFRWFWFAAPFLEFGMTENHFPRGTSNSCEAAGFLFLLPLLLAVVIRAALRRKLDPLLLASIAFVTLLLLFMMMGIPPSLARWTGFSNVSSPKANIAIGLGSTVALFRYLSLRNLRPARGSAPFQTMLFLALSAALIWIFFRTNVELAHFVGPSEIIAAGLFFGLTFLLLWQQRAAASCALLIAPLIYANGSVNPISHGLPGFTESRLFQTIRDVHDRDPTARWLVLGPSERSKILAQFAKATGAEVLGGVRCNPDQEMMRVLDPAEKFRDVVGRYAHISFRPSPEAETTFELTSIAAYTVHLPLSASLMNQLGVRYVLAVDMTAEQLARPGLETVRGGDGSCILRVLSLAP